MVCPYCNLSREANNTPCPRCGAPSPLLQSYRPPQNNAWGPGPANPQTYGRPPFPPTMPQPQWQPNNAMPSHAPTPISPMQRGPMPMPQPPNTQMNNAAPNYSSAPLPPWQRESPSMPMQMPQAPAAPNYSSAPLPPWQRESMPQAPSSQPLGSLPDLAGQTGNGSLLPVVYQAPENTNTHEGGKRTTVSLQVVPDNALQHLMPMDFQPSASLYIPSTITKERPLISRYRIVSGLLSMLIVLLVICSGLGYIAQTHGILSKFVSFYTGSAPHGTSIAASHIPTPPTQTAKDFGPASSNGTIPAATLTDSIDQNNIAKEPETNFKVNQTVYLAFNVQPKQAGTVTIKWYTNNQLYTTVDTPIPAQDINKNNNASTSIKFAQPTSGMVEIYWNNQFAERLYFAVR